MKDEIKEILEALKIDEEDLKVRSSIYPLQLTPKEQKILLDYITNLQEKYERMKENAEILSNGYNELEQKIDKAIEYLEKNSEKVELNFVGFPDSIVNFKGSVSTLLKILKGKSDE